METEEREKDFVKAIDVLGEPEEEEKHIAVKICNNDFLQPAKPPINFSDESQIATIGDCLALFFNKEVLCEKNGNQFACQKCKTEVEGEEKEEKKEKKELPMAIREYFINRPPRMLMLQLKRFVGSGYSIQKNSKHIQAPFDLSLDEYLLLQCNTTPACNP